LLEFDLLVAGFFSQRRRHRLTFRFVTGRNNNPRARYRQSSHCFDTDARGSAGHDRIAALQIMPCDYLSRRAPAPKLGFCSFGFF
jgi:hypothetical protein